MTDANQSTEIKLLDAIYKEQLTQKGLADLRKKYPIDIVHDMTDDEQFKAARKVRTERNNLITQIKDRRIAVAGMIKDRGDYLSSEIEKIYSVIVDPFETELLARKKKEEEEKARLEAILTSQRKEIASFHGFIEAATNADQDEISGMIDAISNIDTADFHKDLVHEAIQTIKDVSKRLGEILVAKIESARQEAERIQAEELQRIAEAETARIKKEADDKLNAEKAKAVVAERINTLRMIPLDLMGKSSKEIRSKSMAVQKVAMIESDWGDRYEEAMQARNQVTIQLDAMADQAIELEKFQANKAKETASSQDFINDQEIMIDEMSVKHPVYHDEEVIDHQVNETRSNQMSPAAALSGMVKASDLIKVTLKSSIDAWYFNHSITEEAYCELMSLLVSHNININV